MQQYFADTEEKNSSDNSHEFSECDETKVGFGFSSAKAPKEHNFYGNFVSTGFINKFDCTKKEEIEENSSDESQKEKKVDDELKASLMERYQANYIGGFVKESDDCNTQEIGRKKKKSGDHSKKNTEETLEKEQDLSREMDGECDSEVNSIKKSKKKKKNKKRKLDLKNERDDINESYVDGSLEPPKKKQKKNKSNSKDSKTNSVLDVQGKKDAPTDVGELGAKSTKKKSKKSKK